MSRPSSALGRSAARRVARVVCSPLISGRARRGAMAAGALTPILAKLIRPLSVELEAKSASSPPGDSDFGDVGLAEHRGVGAPFEPDDDGLLVVDDAPAGGQEPALQGVGGCVVVPGQAAS